MGTDGCQLIGCSHPRHHGADQELRLEAAAQHRERTSQDKMVAPITGLGKDPNSKFEVWFLLNANCSCTIVKLKNPKSGTVCSWDQCYSTLRTVSQVKRKIVSLDTCLGQFLLHRIPWIPTRFAYFLLPKLECSPSKKLSQQLLGNCSRLLSHPTVECCDPRTAFMN